MLQSKKKTQVLETLLDLVNAYSNFFHEGRSYYQDLDVFNQQLAIEIDAMKNKTNTLDKQLEKRHTGKILFKCQVIRIQDTIRAMFSIIHMFKQFVGRGSMAS